MTSPFLGNPFADLTEDLEDDPFADLTADLKPKEPPKITPLPTVRVTADAPRNPIAQGMARAQLAQRGQLQEPRKPVVAPPRENDVGLSVMRGLGEGVYATAQGFANLVDKLPGIENAGESVRRQREEFQQYWGNPETGLGVAAMIGGNLASTGLQFMAPGALAGRLAQGAQAGSTAARALQFLQNPLGKLGTNAAGQVNFAGRVAAGTVAATPANIGLSQSPEDAGATQFKQLGEMMEGKPGILPAAARGLGRVAEPFADTGLGRFVFETGFDLAGGTAFEGAAKGLSGSKQMIRNVLDGKPAITPLNIPNAPRMGAERARPDMMPSRMPITDPRRLLPAQAGTLPTFGQAPLQGPPIPMRGDLANPSEPLIKAEWRGIADQLDAERAAGPNRIEIPPVFNPRTPEQQLDLRREMAGSKQQLQADLDDRRALAMPDMEATRQLEMVNELGKAQRAAQPQSPILRPREGKVDPVLMQQIAGGGIGAAAGATQGNTPEERLRNAALGGAVGAGLPRMAGRGVGLSTEDVSQFATRLYSRLGRQIDNAPFERGTAEQWAAALAKGTSKGEREFTGVDAFLQQNAGRVLNRAEVKQVFDANRVQLGETRYGYELPQLTEKDYTKVANAFEAFGDANPDASVDEMKAEAMRLLRNTPAGSQVPDDALEAAAVDMLYGRSNNLSGPRFFSETDKPTKFYAYSVPGERTNYRELMVQQPGPERFRYTTHWDEPNVMTHVRMSDRVIDGKKTLFVEELQDDWAQQSRKPVGPKDPDTGKRPMRGYRTPEEEAQAAQAQAEFDALSQQRRSMMDRGRALVQKADKVFDQITRAEKAGDFELANMLDDKLNRYNDDLAKHRVQFNELTRRWNEADERLDEFTGRTAPLSGARPFKQTPEWTELGLKRALDEAVQKGYDQVALVTGKQAADMFDLRKQVDELRWTVTSGDAEWGELKGFKNGREVLNKSMAADDLADHVGGELAEQLRFRAGEDDNLVGRVSGGDFEVGGKGMQKFYDEMVPNVIRDYSKKLGVPLTVRRGAGGPGLEDLQNELAQLKQARTRTNVREEVDAINQRMLQIRDVEIPKAEQGTGFDGNLVIEITPQVREKILTEGQPLWAMGGDAGLALGGGLAGGTEGETAEERLSNAALAAGMVGMAGSVRKVRNLRKATAQRTPEVQTLMQSLRQAATKADEIGLTANVELATMADPRFKGVEQLGEDALELQLGAINGTVEPLAKALGLKMGRDVQAKPSFGLWFGESPNADVQPSVMLEFPKTVDQKKALALVAAYSRIAKQKALFYLAPDAAGTRLALSFIVRDADGTPMPSNLVLDLVREGRTGWNGAMLTDDASRTMLVLDDGVSLKQAQAEWDRMESVLESAGFTIDRAGVTNVNAAEVGEKGYAALSDNAGVDRGAWLRAQRDAERLYEGVAVTAEKRVAARRIFERPDAETLELNLDPDELAAVRTPPRRGKPGQVFTGPNHMVANGKAARAGYSQATTEAGYTLTNGEFVNRYEGEAVMELMAERGDALAAKAVDSVQGREESGATSWLRSEDLFAAGRGGQLAKRAEEQVSRFGREGKVYDLGGAVGEGVMDMMRTPGGRELLGKSALTGAGLAMRESEDERLRMTGNAAIGAALGSLAYRGALKPLAKAGAAGLADGLRQSEAGRTALTLLSRDLTTDPAVREVVEQFRATLAKGKATGQELAGEARKLGPQGNRVVSDLVEGESFESVAGMSPDDMAAATALANRIADAVQVMGQQKVEAGLLSPATVAKRERTYLRRMYAQFDAADAAEDVAAQAKGKTFRIEGDRIRNDELTPDERNAMGEIREADYRLAETFGRGYRDIASAKLFNALREMPGVLHPEFATAAGEAATAQAFHKELLAEYKAATTAAEKARIAPLKDDAYRAMLEAKGRVRELQGRFKESAPADMLSYLKRAGKDDYVRLPDTPSMGTLRGAVVRRDVADYLNDLPEMSAQAGFFGRLMSRWKVIHTVYNTGTQVGNFVSNVTNAHMGGIPWWKQPVAMDKAIKDLKSYGPATRALAEAGILDRGLPLYGDLPSKGLYDDRTAMRQLATTTRPETRAKIEEAGLTPMGKGEQALRKADAKIQQSYALGDGIYRVMLMRKYLKDGLSTEDALKKVVEFMPTYDTRSPLLKGLKGTVSPFIMYTAKNVPMLLDKIMEHPERWATLAATWAVVDQWSRRKYGAMDEEDLPPNQRMGKTGYFLPQRIQVDALMRPFMDIPANRHPTIDVARYTPLAALTGSPAPGSLATQLGENVPGILQPGGPWVSLGAQFTNTDPFTGEKLIRPRDNNWDKAKKLGMAAASYVTPSFLSFHTPRVIDDLQAGDPQKAAVDALGILGMRPTMVEPGMQALRDLRRFEDQRRDNTIQFRRDLRDTKDPERRDEIRKKYRENMQRFRQELQERRGR